MTAINGTAVTVGDTITLASGAQVIVNSNGTVTYAAVGAFGNLGAGQQVHGAFNYIFSYGCGGGRLKKRRASSLKRNSEGSCSAASEGPCACDTHRGANGQLKSAGMPSFAWIALVSLGAKPRALESWARYSASAWLSRSMPMAETA